MTQPVEQWAYWWNAPKKAIYRPDLSYKLAYERERFLQKLISAQADINTLPKFLKVIINKQLDDLENAQGQRAANARLVNNIALRTIPRLRMVNERYLVNDNFITAELKYKFNQLADLNTDDVDRLAFDISLYINSEIALICDERPDEPPQRVAFANYRRIANITQQFKQTPPRFTAFLNGELTPDDAITALMKMADPKWWERRLKRYAQAWREHLFIAFGSVSKRNSPYCSNSTKQEWREQRRRTRQYLEFMELEDEDGNRLPLIDKYSGSNANPEIRRCEMMTRIRGLENISIEMGYAADFYTLTAPSKYHATTRTGYKNHRWQGFNPSQTQRYLCDLWAKVRAKLARNNIPIFGIRVAEPHHDGTPHWHMLIFMQPEYRDVIRGVIEQYATKEDAHELTSKKAKKARFHVEEINPEKGSATGYVAKYISKNIDGFALDNETDNDTGEALSDTAAAAMAWAARWRIRQFQFIGGAPVTVYRELRRLADSETAQALDLEFAAVHDAADSGNFGEYVKAQGGAFVKRADLVVRMEYVIQPETNEYGEEVKKIYGVACRHVTGSPIRTRVKQWKIVRPNNDRASGQGAALDLKREKSRSRSSVNNCTEPVLDDQRQKIASLLKSRGIPPNPDDITRLLRGSSVDFGGGIRLKIQSGEIVEQRHDSVFIVQNRFNKKRRNHLNNNDIDDVFIKLGL